MSKVVVKGLSLEEIAKTVTTEVNQQLESRTYRAANELRNAALLVLRGQRSGRSYKVSGTYRRQRDKATGKMKNGRYYTASAPGEPPAVRTGTFRNSWQPRTFAFGTSYIARIESNVPYADWLENGTPGGQMAPRPHHDRIAKHAEPKIFRIYDEPYFNE